MHSWTNGLSYQITGFKNVGEEIGLGSAQRTDVQIIALSSWKKEDEISSSQKFLAWEEKLDKMMTRLNCQYFSFLNISQFVPLLIVKDDFFVFVSLIKKMLKWKICFAINCSPFGIHFASFWLRFSFDKVQIFGRCTQEELAFCDSFKAISRFPSNYVETILHLLYLWILIKRSEFSIRRDLKQFQFSRLQSHSSVDDRRAARVIYRQTCSIFV